MARQYRRGAAPSNCNLDIVVLASAWFFSTSAKRAEEFNISMRLGKRQEKNPRVLHALWFACAVRMLVNDAGDVRRAGFRWGSDQADVRFAKLFFVDGARRAAH